MSPPAKAINRFYETVTLNETDGRFAVVLDGRTARTIGKNPLAAPTEALGEAVAGEWRAQGEHIEQSTMPLTGMLSVAIDGGADAAREWRGDVLDYLGSDLVCYRAEAPASLAEKQEEVWAPYIDFLRSAFGAPLICTSGIVAVKQPEIASAAIARALDGQSPETLFALRLATAISGSAVLALSLWRGGFDHEAVFAASRVDECFQEEQWGVDAEAKEREDRLRGEFLSIGRFLTLLSA